MGCCLSTLDENKSNPNPNPSPNPNPTRNPIGKNHQFSCVSKSPPRPEEETVKEVLSETPKPVLRPKLKPVPEPEIKNGEEPTKPNILVSPKKLPFLDQKLPFLEKKLPTLNPQNQFDPITPEEISEVSEICSLSETISTNTLDEHHQCGLKDSANSGEVRQRVYKSQGHSRHFAKNNNNNNVQLGSRNRIHGRPPVRRADPSPPRKRYPGPGGPRREVSGENPTRRSRSPATRGNVGRSPSARRTGPSPGRVRMVNGPGSGHGLESVRKVEEESNVRRNGNEDDGGGPQESLENPLVSLECFIFL